MGGGSTKIEMVPGNSISEKCEYLLKNQQWTDCEFSVGIKPNTEVFKAHKFVLSLSSPIFAEMCSKKEDTFSIPDVEPTVFGKLLDYMYHDNYVVTDMDTALSLYFAAKKYMLLNLLENCSKVIKNQIDTSPSEACRGHGFAKMTEDTELQEKTYKIIVDNINNVLTDLSDGQVLIETWNAILDTPDLKIKNESELFRVFDQWTKNNCKMKGMDETAENLRSVAGDVVQKFRFLSMTAEEFSNGPGLSLFLKDESYAILMNIINNGSTYPMPNGFLTERQPRTIQKQTIVLEEYFPHRKAFPKNNTFNLEFGVSRKVQLDGIEICTADFLVTLQDVNGEVLAYTSKTTHKPQSTLENSSLFFVPARELEPDQRYKIVVTNRSQSSLYFYPKINLTQTCKGVTFTFQHEDNVRLVRSIIFSCNKGVPDT